jgi:hypothetical protein
LIAPFAKEQSLNLAPQITGGKKHREAMLIAIRVNLLCYVVYISIKKKRTTYAQGKRLSTVPLLSKISTQANEPIGPG